MKDVNGKPIIKGANLKRVVEGRGTSIGHKYTAIETDFYDNGKLVLVADGGFIQELLTPERAEEFEVIE